MSDASPEPDAMGPIDYLVIEWSGGTGTGEGLPLLLDLADSGVIRILDLAFVRRLVGGSFERIPLDALPVSSDFDATVFDGASAGILGADDFAEAIAVVEDGAVVGILVYENRWAAPLAVALRRGGGQLVASGRIPVQAVLAALDATE